LLGPLVGPPLGGFITTYVNWRWIFFINIPISVLGIFLGLHFMDNIREATVPPLDTSGLVLSASGLSMLMFGLSTINERVISHEFAFACIVIGSAVTFLYFRLARHKTSPLLDFDLFKVKTFWVGVGGGSLFRIGIGAIAFVLPLMFQLGFGLSPLQSGMLTCASAVGAMFMKSILKIFLRRYGFRSVLISNVFLASATVACMGLFTAKTPHWLIYLVLLIGGCFRALQFTSLNAITYADISEHDVSQATSVFATVQQLSLGLGVTVGAFAVQASSFLQGHRTIVAGDFWPAFLVLGIIAASSAYCMFSLSPDAGADMAGYRPRAGGVGSQES
jgi:MFS family permease